MTIHHTLLTDEATGGLGELAIHHPPGTFALTPASLIALQTVGRRQSLLHGVGVDWGSGTGVLAMAAARVTAVTHVVGLEISAANVTIARQNAYRNGVADKTRFFRSDAYTPYDEAERRDLAALAGHVNFILANPPASDGDDGFAFRRVVLRGARDFLAAGGVVFLSVSFQYGRERIRALCDQVPGFRYEGELHSSDWVPFDLARPDLRQCLRDYVAEENGGGLPYAFHAADGSGVQSAQSALAHFETTGQSPLTRWQTHLFRHLYGSGQ